MTRPRDARGRFAPRYLPAPDWTLLRVGLDQITAEPEPLRRQVLPPRKAPTPPRGMEWTVSPAHLVVCMVPLIAILLGACAL